MRQAHEKHVGWEYDSQEQERLVDNQLFNFGEILPETFHSLKLDLTHRVVRDLLTGESAHLTAQEYQALWLLYRANDAIVPSEKIFGFIYDDVSDNTDVPRSNVSEALLHKVRKILESVSRKRVSIHAVAGLGYQIVPYEEHHKKVVRPKMKAVGVADVPVAHRHSATS